MIKGLSYTNHTNHSLYTNHDSEKCWVKAKFDFLPIQYLPMVLDFPVVVL
ncbi:MAG: hypothetical protein RLZZ86_2231, partial [Cyanobacteriota bacterium]